LCRKRKCVLVSDDTGGKGVLASDNKDLKI
jgi:hypothetical protein